MVFKLTSVGLEASGVITSSSANIDANISASNVDTSTSGSSSNTPPNEITIDSKRFLSTISFSASNPLPTYTAIPYKLKVNNSLVHTNDQVFVTVQSTDANICANAFYIKEGFFKINAFTYDTSTPYTGDLILNVYVPT